MKVAIIDYGMGNVASVKKAFTFLGVESVLTRDAEEIVKSTHVVLPGVGAFKQGMDNLNSLGIVEILNHEILLKKKPFLGICLGMQLIASTGEETENCKGLGWIEGTVTKINQENMRIPHLGWNQLYTTVNSPLKQFEGKDFYFIHSYHFLATNQNHVIANVDYGSTYVAAVQKDNIMAVQFHPEKSQQDGLNLLKLFVNLNA
jgi:glutamine amidotransferase